MKKKIIFIILFMFILVIPSIIWPIVEPYDIELNENRNKASAPTWSDDYFSKLEDYFNDRAPFRNISIRTYSKLKLLLNKCYDSVLYNLNIDYYNSVNNVLFGKNDWLFYLGDESLDYYKGVNLPTESELKDYLEGAKKVDQYFKNQGKEFVLYIAPNKNEIYYDYMPDTIRVLSEKRRIDIILDYIKENSDIKIVYPKTELLDHKNEYQLYYKQDTHWNTVGGLVGAQKLLTELGMESGEYTIHDGVRAGGDLSNFAALEGAEDVEYYVNYRPEVTIVDSYSNAPETLVSISDNPNNKKLVLLGDSFRNAMRGYISKEFTNTYFTHYGNFNTELRSEFDSADVVVFQCVARYDRKIFENGGILDRFIDYFIMN